MDSINCLMIMKILFLSISLGFGHNLNDEFINVFYLKNNLPSTAIDRQFVLKCIDALRKSSEGMNCEKYYTPKLEEMSSDDKKCCKIWYAYECSKDLIIKICSSIDSNKAKQL